MNIDDFLKTLKSFTDDEQILDFCRKHVLHGIPFVFSGKDEEYYDFRKIISEKFEVPFHEIYITGSGKLGFSYYKQKPFDYDSDIDIAIISSGLFEKIMKDISQYQMRYRKSRTTVSDIELKTYHTFLEYVALGWIRPDKLPISFQMKAIKDDWFSFFSSLSYGRSSVGNYKVAAGVFKSYQHFEDYIVNGLKDLKIKTNLEK